MKRMLAVALFFLVLCPCLAAAADTAPAAALSPDTLAFLSSLAAPEAAAPGLTGLGVPAPTALACGPGFCTQAQRDECDEMCFPCPGRPTCNFTTCIFTCRCGTNCVP